MLRLVLIRHGQTDANFNRILQGQSDGVLNATGRQQVEALGKQLADLPIDMIISSTLQRAYHTASAIARHHKLQVNTTPLIVEWNCGTLDGQSAELFHETLQKSLLPLSQFRPEGGETLLEVRQRAEVFLTDLITNYSGQTVVVCSHGDFLRALMSVIQQISIEEASSIRFENASYTILELEAGHWKLVALNQLAPDENETVVETAVQKENQQVK